MRCYLLSLHCTCPKRNLRKRMDLLCNQGKSGHGNSGEIDLQWYQVVSRDVRQRVSFPSFAIESRCYLLLSFRWRESFCISLLYKYYTLIYKIRLDYRTFITFCPSATFGTHKEYWCYLYPFTTLVPPKDPSNPSPMKLSPPSKVFLQDPTFGIRTGTKELDNRAYSRSPLSRCFETMASLPTIDVSNTKILNADIYCLIYHGRVSHLASLQML